VTSVAPPGSGTSDSAARAGSTAPSPALSGAIDKNGDPTDAAKTFMLTSNLTELPRHVGQEVEVSGSLVAPASGSSTGAATTSGSASASRGGAMPQIEVKSIRMIASVCAAR